MVGTAFNSGAIFKRVAFSADYVARTVTARPQPRSPMGRGRAPGLVRLRFHQTVQRRFGRSITARAKGEKNREDLNGSNNALPEMQKTNGSGYHLLRSDRSPMHKL